ncbi:MAG: glycosyltransferase family 2 protein [Candidatus Anammoxibacter sp.]
MAPSFFSIIIPTYNRPEQLASCLQSIADLDYSIDRFEVIVIDDGSATSPETLITSFKDKIAIELITQMNKGPAVARNAGAEKAKGEYVAFIDDDCTVASDWLKTLSKCFAENERDIAIGGKVINKLTANPYSTASQLLIDYLYDYYNVNPDQAQFLVSMNFALSADSFRKIGGFSNKFPRAAGEDRELCDRWLQNGNRMIFASDVAIYHYHNHTFRTFFRQHFNYGRSAFKFRLMAAKQGKRHVIPEPLSFYINLILFPALQVRGLKVLLPVTLMVISQAANLAGFVWEWFK